MVERSSISLRLEALEPELTKTLRTEVRRSTRVRGGGGAQVFVAAAGGAAVKGNGKVKFRHGGRQWRSSVEKKFGRVFLGKKLSETLGSRTLKEMSSSGRIFGFREESTYRRDSDD